MPLELAIKRNVFMRSLNAIGSYYQTNGWMKTLITLNPMLYAYPSSLVIVGMSKVSAYHISRTLTAVLGMKLQPANQPPLFEYH